MITFFHLNNIETKAYPPQEELNHISGCKINCDVKGNYIKDCSGDKMDMQDGWNLIFEFKGIPMHGSCVIRYV